MGIGDDGYLGVGDLAGAALAAQLSHPPGQELKPCSRPSAS